MGYSHLFAAKAALEFTLFVGYCVRYLHFLAAEAALDFTLCVSLGGSYLHFFAAQAALVALCSEFVREVLTLLVSKAALDLTLLVRS